jgi:hypothetical protein
MATVRWADANLEDEQFVMKPYATNEIAEEPAGKLEIIQGLANAGLVLEKTDVMRMLNMPDLKSYQSLTDATYDWTMSIVDSILKKGVYKGPQPFMTKSQMIDAIGRVQRAYFKADREAENVKDRGVVEERLQMLRDWMIAATEMVNSDELKLPEPAPPMPPPGMGPPPMGPPGMPMPGGPMPPPMPMQGPPMAA